MSVSLKLKGRYKILESVDPGGTGVVYKAYDKVMKRKPMITGSAVASFRNGNAAVTLAPLGDGHWEGTWISANGAGVTGVEVKARARALTLSWRRSSTNRQLAGSRIS